MLVTRVEPLKTGAGLLRVAFVRPLHPGGAVHTDVEGRVVQRSGGHLTLLQGRGAHATTMVFAEPDRRWLETQCSRLLERRPPEIWRMQGDDSFDRGDAEPYLRHVFGGTPDDVLAGTGAGSFPVRRSDMPERHESFALDLQLEPFDSVLVARGFLPREMEDKWFIHAEQRTLVFRRSWTGHVVFVLEIEWSGPRLLLGRALVNRDPDQYGGTDLTEDRRLLIDLVDGLLRGIPPHNSR